MTTEVEKDKESKYRKWFRRGVKNSCAKAVWQRMKAEIVERLRRLPDEDFLRDKDSIKDREVAAYIHHSDSDVSRFGHGAMNDVAMFGGMCELGWEGKNLDPLPTLAEREISGYQYMVYKLRGGKKETPKEGSDHEFIDKYLWMTIKKLSEWFARTRKDAATLTEPEWDELHREICQIIPGGGSRLKELYNEWWDSVTDSLDTIPYKWLRDDAS